MKNISSIRYALACAWLCVCPWSQAQGQDSASLYLQAGAGEHAAYNTSVGVTLPWSWAYQWGGGQVTGQWDVGLGGLSARPEAGRRRDLVSVGAGINLRWHPAQGHSRWFTEAGTGLVWHSRHYASDDKYFSTRYNFASHLGVGRNFGPQGRHTLALRVQHISNAGVKHPNPGDNFLLVRYSLGY